MIIFFGRVICTIISMQSDWELIFRDSIPLCEDIYHQTPITQHIGQSIWMFYFLIIILGIFMVLLSSRFNSVARPKDKEKAISPLMMLVFFSFFEWQPPWVVQDVLLKIGPRIHLLSCHSVPSAMQVDLNGIIHRFGHAPRHYDAEKFHYLTNGMTWSKQLKKPWSYLKETLSGYWRCYDLSKILLLGLLPL